jgi:hypothetical protein
VHRNEHSNGANGEANGGQIHPQSPSRLAVVGPNPRSSVRTPRGRLLLAAPRSTSAPSADPATGAVMARASERPRASQSRSVGDAPSDATLKPSFEPEEERGKVAAATPLTHRRVGSAAHDEPGEGRRPRPQPRATSATSPSPVPIDARCSGCRSRPPPRSWTAGAGTSTASTWSNVDEASASVVLVGEQGFHADIEKVNPIGGAPMPCRASKAPPWRPRRSSARPTAAGVRHLLHRLGSRQTGHLRYDTRFLAESRLTP